MAAVGFLEAQVLTGAVGVRLLSLNGVERITRKWDSLTELAVINGCVDEYTNLPVTAIQYEFSIGKHYEELVVTFSTVIICLVAVPLLTTACLFAQEFLGSRGHTRDDSDDEYAKIDAPPS